MTPEILKGDEVGGAKRRQIRIHHRQFFMAVSFGATVTRDVLDHRYDARGDETFAGSRREGGHHFRILGKSAVADHVMRARDRNVHHRRAIHIDAESGKFLADQLQIGPEG